MNRSLQYLIVFLFLAYTSFAQSIKVEPYLQDASPTSISILWETDGQGEPVVEWGLTEELGNISFGSTEVSEGNAVINTVTIEGLNRFTKYYYSVGIGAMGSAIYSFKTPPFASDQESFRIIAMSDMQRDGAFPNKFNEIVQDGIIDYLDTEFGGDLVDNLALVMIPGDLVVTGSNYSQWEQHFFDPSHGLFNRVPVYPVLGNHEQNSTYYFQYFKLPENGTEGYEEHWWYKDYGNVRIIGLNSNNPFANQDQLDWLEEVLENTCASDSTDFVFAQLHHPHKSELWTPGESSYTGQVIEMMEQFSTDCGKPSIHFFGHTHGYSRGQSRDHKHLWINAATAGGAIDNWGEFPNFDYDEFSVSQDEYGFVSVEVSSGAEPSIHVKRISRGDQDGVLGNVVTDSVLVRLNPTELSKPEALYPVNVEVAPECVDLNASEFIASGQAALHGQSHWQVALSVDEFSAPVAESWKNFENWYFDEDTQAGDDLTDEKIIGLSENTSYWWRVRYRDREMNWSAWSEPVTFNTGASITSPNLIVNAGSEDSLSAWTITEGIVESLTAGICEGISPNSGQRYFAVGGLCEESPVGICLQGVDVTMYADSIDTGDFYANFGGYMSNYSGSDVPEMRLIYLDQNSVEIGSTAFISNTNSSWTLYSNWEVIPSGTRIIQLELKGTRYAGTDNDSYFDDLFLRLGSGTDCNPSVSVSNIPMRYPILQVVPNPVSDTGMVILPQGQYTNPVLQVVNSRGVKVHCPYDIQSEGIWFEKGALKTGTYTFWVRSEGRILGSGKIVIF
jgi:hypothetical protein